MEAALQRRKIWQIADDYFDLMGRHFPVLSLSDEFYFFPRAKRGLDFLEKLDDLDQDTIGSVIARVKRMDAALTSLEERGDLETSIDRSLLRQSMATFLREFSESKVWQSDPSLYLKIILLGLEHILVKAPYFKNPLKEELLSRLRQIPRLVQQARKNLKNVSLRQKTTSLEVIESSLAFLDSLSFERLTPSFRREARSAATRAILALSGLKRHLAGKPASQVKREKEVTAKILRDSFSYRRSLDEVFDIAESQLKKTLAAMDTVAKKRTPRKSWRKFISESRAAVHTTEDLLSLYRGQIEKIKTLLKTKGTLTIPRTPKIIVRPTPSYLLPLRASASYACAISQSDKEPGFFYITPDLPHIHQEYIFLTAHETFPGHHLLDSLRKGLKNPVRSQIESALFYEGWSSYAEGLIYQLGDIRSHPEQRLLGLKRRAWRAVRAMLDSGLTTKRITLTRIAGKLSRLGYAPKAVKAMLRHYLLTPGYQLCYTIGTFELERLKDRFAPKLGVRGFHDAVLTSGQIPFDLLEKRLEAMTCPKNS